MFQDGEIHQEPSPEQARAEMYIRNAHGVNSRPEPSGSIKGTPQFELRFSESGTHTVLTVGRSRLAQSKARRNLS